MTSDSYLNSLPLEIPRDEVLAALRFCQTCEDNEGFDVPKSMMKQLQKRGIVMHVGGGYYQGTPLLDRLQEEYESGTWKSFVITGMPTVLFHGTSEGAFRKIMNDGLLPKNNKIYATDDEHYARHYALLKGGSTSRLLRLEFDSSCWKEDPSNIGGDWISHGAIPPDKIEVETPIGWVPLLDIRLLETNPSGEPDTKSTPKKRGLDAEVPSLS